ncbi:hypothetical protein [Actinomadura sp. NTSP31]|uniref:hypothetical protein n=1 Tax=Actinomadura sp. NTSP31 TaxID=1735447 RepID=UPI0035C01FB8
MTDILEVALNAREGRTLTGSVTALNAHHTKFSRRPEFGVQLIIDAWDRPDAATGPLAPATEAEFRRLFELFMGRKVRVDADGFLVDEPGVKAEERHRRELSGSFGSDEDGPFVSLKPDPDGFRRHTKGMVMAFELAKTGRGSADFTLKVTSERYLAHLENPVTFRTTFTGLLP